MLITLNILLVLLRCLAALPLKVLYTFTGFVSWLLRVVFRYRREVVTVNLARSFPDKSYDEIRQLSKQFYRHLGEIFAETLWFGGCRKGERFRRQGLVVETNSELLDTLKGERGALVMTSHCGNWELLGGMMEYDPREGASRPYAAADVVVVYKQLSNQVWNEVMRLNRSAPARRLGFNGYVSSKEILRYALTHRGEGKWYFFPNDQFPYANARVSETVSFMHQKTKVMLGAAALARKLALPVVYMGMASVARGRYEVTYTLLTSDASQIGEKELMEKYFSLLERDLESIPWNYLWSHKRWK